MIMIKIIISKWLNISKPQNRKILKIQKNSGNSIPFKSEKSGQKSINAKARFDISLRSGQYW